MTAEIFNIYPGATPETMRAIRRAAKECSAFAVMTPDGPELTQRVNILDEHDPRARAFARLQLLDLKARGIVNEF